MKRLIRRKAVLWLGDRAVYAAKTEENFFGTCQAAWVNTFTDHVPVQWLEKTGTVKQVMEKIISVYGLMDFTVTLVVAGPQLFLQLLKLPVSDYLAAKEAAAWNESIADQNEHVYYDVCRISDEAEQEMYPWLLAAYPREILDTACQCLCKAGSRVAGVEVLPLLVANQYDGGDGSILLQEYDNLHIIQIKKQRPHGYHCEKTDSVPAADECIPFRVQFQKDNGGALSKPVWKEKKVKFWQKWQLKGPASLLL